MNDLPVPLRLVLMAATSGLLLWPNPANAAPGASGSASVSGGAAGRGGGGAAGARFRFHGDTDFFGFTHVNPDDSADTNVNIVGFGFGRPVLADSGGIAGIGIRARPVWGLGFGYVFAQSRAIVGGRFSFTVDGISFDDSDDNTTVVSGQFLPYFRWMFLPGARFRPFVQAQFGLGGDALIFEDADADSESTTNVIYPQVGISGGVSIFIVRWFSFDTGVSFDFYSPHSKTKVVVAGMEVQDDDYEKVADVFNLAVSAGFSAWFGGG